jgi:hypothetical protein
MNSREKYAAFSDTLSFETVLDQTCELLWDRKIQHSIRRIRDMEQRLSELERDLDALTLLEDRKK